MEGEGERGRRREEHKAVECRVAIDNLNVVHRNLVHVMMRSGNISAAQILLADVQH